MGSYPRHVPNQARLRCHKVRHGGEGEEGRVDDVWKDRGGEYVKNINIKIRQNSVTRFMYGPYGFWFFDHFVWTFLISTCVLTLLFFDLMNFRRFEFRPFEFRSFDFSTLWIFDVLNFDLLNFVHLIFRPYDFRAFDFSTWWFSCFWFFDHFVSTFWISGFCNSALCRAPTHTHNDDIPLLVRCIKDISTAPMHVAKGDDIKRRSG